MGWIFAPSGLVANRTLVKTAFNPLSPNSKRVNVVMLQVSSVSSDPVSISSSNM